MVKQLLTIDQAAEILQVSKVTFWRMRRNGKGPPVTPIDGKIRFHPDDFNEWLKGLRGDEQQQALLDATDD